MARYIGANCKLCRRESEKLFLKGSKCSSGKCALERKGYAPGQHGKNKRFKVSEYGTQLREKQKARQIYGIFEKQFRNYFKKAEREKGITGTNLLKLLERRLDNVVYRLGLAPSRKSARQLINHRHFMINNNIVDIPSYLVKKGDIIKVKDKSKKLELIHNSMKRIREAKQYPWLSLNKANLAGEFLDIPERSDIPVQINEKLIVELYSK